MPKRSDERLASAADGVAPETRIEPDPEVLDEIESRLNGRRRYADDDYGDERAGRLRRRTRDHGDRIIDETSSVTRALSVAYLSQIRLAADIASTFATAVLDGTLSEEPAPRASESRRNGAAPSNGSAPPPERRRRRSGWDDFPDVVEDVADGFLDAFDDAVEVPRRVLDDFYDTYDRARPRRNGARH